MRASQSSHTTYPLATISAYGSDNRRATKLVVGILRRAGQKAATPMRMWSSDAGDIRNDPVIASEVADWLRSQGIKDRLSYDRIIGCPHEEGIDDPMGRTCPQHASAVWRDQPCPRRRRAPSARGTARTDRGATSLANPCTRVPLHRNQST